MFIVVWMEASFAGVLTKSQARHRRARHLSDSPQSPRLRSPGLLVPGLIARRHLHKAAARNVVMDGVVGFAEITQHVCEDQCSPFTHRRLPSGGEIDSLPDAEDF
jgi:hypothetical protein